jgi:putative phosphoribosyl transferase
MIAVKTYLDRMQAGQILARQLKHHVDRPLALVLALPRGGVPVAHEVAKFIHAPLDVFVVRKLGVPGDEELAMGAIASGGLRLLNMSVIEGNGVSEGALEMTTAEQTAELKRREQLYRGDRPLRPITGRVVIVVDDGLATGFSMRAALKGLRALKPAWLAAAVPVGAPESCEELYGDADEVICPLRPTPFRAVGLWYDHFAPTSDEEVREILERNSPPLQ